MNPILKGAALAAVFVAEVALILGLATSVSGKPTDVVVIGDGDALIEVADQEMYGAVSIARVVTPADAWLTIRAEGPDGEPAELIGATLVEAGESRDVAVVVDRDREPSSRLFAVLAADLGQPGEFEYATGYPEDASLPLGGASMGMAIPTDEGPDVGGMGESADKLMVTSDGPVIAGFAVSFYDVVVQISEAWIGDAHTVAPGRTIVVERVITPRAGWVALIRGPFLEGDENELIAVVPVPAGSTHRLEIPAPDDLAPGGFTAVLCVDLGLKGTPEIDPTDLLASPDAPYFALSYFVQVPVRVIR